MAEKAKQSGPAAALLAAGGLLALGTIASSYQLSLRLLEKRLSPAGAALAATVGYGAAAAGVAALAIREFRKAPAPVPVQTVREASRAVAGANSETGQQPAPGATGSQRG